MIPFIRALVLVSCVLIPTQAFAWGEDGHSIVCEIAWQNLDPQIQARISELLEGDEDKTFAASCSWADRVLRQRDSSFDEFHFVNAPEGSAAVPPCPGKCVVNGIEQFVSTLRDPSASDADRLFALKLVGHFIGDIHQPLHAGYSSDRGGNSTSVSFLGRSSNLHRVWDSLIIAEVGSDWREYAARLASDIHPIDRTLWSGGTPIAWANESYQLVEGLVYDGAPTLDEFYFERTRGVVEDRLQAAGLRLAETLNAALALSPTDSDIRE